MLDGNYRDRMSSREACEDATVSSEPQSCQDVIHFFFFFFETRLNRMVVHCSSGEEEGEEGPVDYHIIS